MFDRDSDYAVLIRVVANGIPRWDAETRKNIREWLVELADEITKNPEQYSSHFVARKMVPTDEGVSDEQ